MSPHKTQDTRRLSPSSIRSSERKLVFDHALGADERAALKYSLLFQSNLNVPVAIPAEDYDCDTEEVESKPTGDNTESSGSGEAGGAQKGVVRQLAERLCRKNRAGSGRN